MATLSRLQLHTSSYSWHSRGLHAASRLHAASTRPRASSGEAFTPLEKNALRETAGLLQQAQEMAELQTRAELMSSLAADALEDGAAQQQGTEDNVFSFWLEQGLKAYEARRLTQELAAGGAPLPTLAQLAAKMQRISRVLPDADVVALVCRESRLLRTPSSRMVENLVALIQLGCRDVTGMVSRHPGLLAAEDLQGAAERALGKLVSIHPSGSLQVALEIVQEHPSLLQRLNYYMDASSLEDLPIEILNMLVLGDHGIGFLYKYYRGQLQAGGSADRGRGSDSGTQMDA